MIWMKTSKARKMKTDRMAEVSTLFMRAKTKQAKITKNRIKSERCRYILKEIMVLGLEWE